MNIHPFTKTSTSSSSSFNVMITGQIESASFPSTMNNLYCRYVISYGKDWNITHGVTSGLSQIAQWHHVNVKNLSPLSAQRTDTNGSSKSTTRNPHQHQHQHQHQHYRSHTPTIVWNFPIEISFQSTNVHGWPRISIAVYGLDFLGRDVVRGYASLLIPTSSGLYEEYVDTYRPISGSICHQFMNWLHGSLPEYYETTFTARGEGRAMTRVLGEGSVKVALNVIIKDLKKFGFASS